MIQLTKEAIWKSNYLLERNKNSKAKVFSNLGEYDLYRQSNPIQPVGPAIIGKGENATFYDDTKLYNLEREMINLRKGTGYMEK